MKFSTRNMHRSVMRLEILTVVKIRDLLCCEAI